MGVGITEFLIILLIVLLFFGGKRLPDLGKSLGQSIVNFKNELKNKDKDES